jgi:hypothetical protein
VFAATREFVWRKEELNCRSRLATNPFELKREKLGHHRRNLRLNTDVAYACLA